MSTHYVIVIFPAHAHTHGIERFRAAWDPLAREIPVHITLVYPFQTADGEDRLRATVADVARRHQPFAVDLGEPTVHEDEYLFLLPRKGREQIVQLHRELYAAIPDAQLRGGFVPHMTIGRNADPDLIERAGLEASASGLAVDTRAEHLSVYRLPATGARSIGFQVSLGEQGPR